jgi:hypothetical protein
MRADNLIFLIFGMCGSGREAGGLSSHYTVLRQARVERVEKPKTQAIAAIVTLLVERGGKMDRPKVCLAKGQRDCSPEHCQHEDDRHSNRHTP